MEEEREWEEIEKFSWSHFCLAEVEENGERGTDTFFLFLVLSVNFSKIAQFSHPFVYQLLNL